MKFDAPSELPSGGGNWIDKPGTYHLIITGTDEEPVSRDKQLLDGFRIDFQALDGTVRDADGNFTEAEKTIDIIFWHPKLTQKNEGLFNKQKQAAFLVAAGLMTEEQLGKSLDIDLSKAKGRHVIATFEEEVQDNGKKRIQLSYADIWHIDDPRAAKFPKNEKALSLIPSDHRRDPKSFKQPEPAQKKEPAAATSSVDLDNL